MLRRHESHIIDEQDGDHISNGPLTEPCPEGMKAISLKIWMETTFPMVPKLSLCTEGMKAISLMIWMGTTFPMVPELGLCPEDMKAIS